VDAALKTAIFLGAVMLAGGGAFARWVGFDALTPRARRLLRFGVCCGALLVIAGSLGEVAMTVSRILRGRFDLALFFDYLTTTRHGYATLARTGLALLLAFVASTRLERSRWERALYALAALALLASISVVSHSGTMSTAGFVGDLAHLVAAALWAGSLLYLAWLPLWRSERLAAVVKRVSRIGLLSVALMSATGIYLSALHLSAPRELTTTGYGLALVTKLVLVALILAVAALNRWWLVPLVSRGHPHWLKRAVRAESLLLVAVLTASGVLATREPPHEHADHAEVHTALPPTPATPGQPRHNRVVTAAGTLLVHPGPAGSLQLMVEDHTTVEIALEAVSPSGQFEALLELTPTGVTRPLTARTLQGHEALGVLLPDEDGLWQLIGVADGEAFTLPISRHHLLLGDGLDVTLWLVPTPSLASRGLTEAFAFLRDDGAPSDEPLWLRYHMPGMQHASDDDRFELTRIPGHHDPNLRHATLFLPMAGAWEATVIAGDHEASFELQVLE
jgi:putative copper export protein